MSSEKTEQPTLHKLRQARKDGQVAHSKDFTQTLLIVALFGYTLANSETIVRQFSEMILLPATLYGADFWLAVDIMGNRLLRLGVEMLTPYLLLVIGLGLAAEFWQTGMNISFKAAAPSFKKLDVGQNVKNVFSAKNLFEFVKSLTKIVLLSILVFFMLRGALPTLMTLPYGGMTAVAVATAALLQTLLLQVSLGYAVIAITDLLWQRRQHIKQLKMSKDEIKQEYKQQEGDPHFKHKRKELHREMMDDKEVQKTRMASVVVTNPTHLAVALAYKQDVTPLPIVVAMGADALAHRITAMARSCDIPVMQNIPLARALTANAQVGEYIPPELIEPVAQVLRLVQEMTNNEE